MVLIHSYDLLCNNYYQLLLMKKLGILRNRLDRLTTIKKQAHRKKNRFQTVGKQDLQDINTVSLTTTNSDPISHSEMSQLPQYGTSKAIKLFEQSRDQLKKVAQVQRKMAELSKARLSCLRQKENQKYDDKIAKLAGEATTAILSAEASMRQISKIEGNSSAANKILKSMQSSLAAEVQEVSRGLRLQQQQYFKRVKSYEGTTNSAIQLTAEQRKSMEGEQEWEVMAEKEEDSHQGRVGELVGSISRLSALYKELSQLVVTQGSVIDRIDYNLEETEQHVTKAIVHLQGADTEASSPFADKIIKTLVITIILMAIVLGLKYMK